MPDVLLGLPSSLFNFFWKQFQAATFEIEIQSSNMEMERAYVRHQRSRDTYLRDMVTLQRLLADYDPDSEMRNGTLMWLLHFEVQFVIDDLRKRKKSRSKIKRIMSKVSNVSSKGLYRSISGSI